MFKWIAKFFRNLPLVKAILSFAASSNSQERIESLERVETWALEKRGDEEHRALKSSLKGRAADLLELDDLRSHLSRTQHLGLLAPLAPRSLRRSAYVAKQAQVLLELKRAHPSLGLGARISSLPEEPTGLELAQSWGVLFSYGHLWATQATERAVLFELRRSKGLKAKFVAQFGRYSELARRHLSTADIYQLNEVLVLKRLVDQPETKASIFSANAVSAWLESTDPAVDRVRKAFRLARRLAYLEMHSLVGLEPALSPRLVRLTIERVAEHEGIAFLDHEAEASPYDALLHELDRFHFETFFTSPQASASVLSHLREFKTWWTSRERQASALTSLFKKPDDWPRRDSIDDLFPVLRFVLPLPHRSWKREVEFWWQGGAAWGQTANCFITHVPRGQTLQCDVFAGRLLSSAEVHHVLAQFARYLHSESVRDDLRVSVGKSVTKIVHYLLEAGLRGGRRLVFRPLENAGLNQYSTIGYSRSAMVARIQSVADDAERNPGRQHELRACASFLEQLPESDSAIYAFYLGRLLILDESNREVAEVDGVFVESTNERTQVRIVEVKRAGLAGAKKQLQRIQDEMGCEHLPMSDHQVDGGALRSFCYSWPPTGGEVGVSELDE